jgi:hypothetical protein
VSLFRIIRVVRYQGFRFAWVFMYWKLIGFRVVWEFVYGKLVQFRVVWEFVYGN